MYNTLHQLSELFQYYDKTTNQLIIYAGIINGTLADEYTLLVCVRATITSSGNKHSSN